MVKPSILRQRNKRVRGGSLIEILLALFVFVVAGSGIIGAFLSAQYLAEDARETSAMVEDLRAIVEHIHSTPFASITTDFPDGVADGGGANDYAAIVGGYTLLGEGITVTYPVQVTGAIEVVVTGTWTQRGRSRTANISTFRTNS